MILFTQFGFFTVEDEESQYGIKKCKVKCVLCELFKPKFQTAASFHSRNHTSMMNSEWVDLINELLQSIVNVPGKS